MNDYELLKKVTRYGYKAFGIKDSSLLLLLTLLSYYNHKTGECFPSRASIKDSCGMDERTQRNAQRKLLEAGVLKVYNKPMGDVNRHNGYVLNLELIEAAI